MKINLVVHEGIHKGKTIPINLTQFLIGRDPQCQLRPSSPLISKRHCALLVRAGKVFVRDFESTNGTFVNDEPLKGERELRSEDILKVGPLFFQIRIEDSAPVNKPTPLPPTKAPGANAPTEEESVAAMLLELKEDRPSGDNSPLGGEVPQGSTVLDIPALPEPEKKEDKPAGKPPPAKVEAPNTSNAAKAILDKYMRRRRT